MFQTVPLSVISSFFTVHTAMVYVIQLASSKPLWHIQLLCVQWKTAGDGHRNWSKHVDFYSKNKFEKFVQLVGFIIRIYHDARSPERQFITMHGHRNVNLSRCTVNGTSIYHDARSPARQFITMHGQRNVNLSRCTVNGTSIYHDARSLERQIVYLVCMFFCPSTWNITIQALYL